MIFRALLFLLGFYGVAHAATSGPTDVPITITPASINLPTGVTLQAIDGETLTGANNASATTNTHSFYTSGGFTNAASSSFNANYNNGGWDDPRFFPILDDYSCLYMTAAATNNLHLTGSFRGCNGNSTDYATYRNGGLYVVMDGGFDSASGVETVGITYDEPPDWSTLAGVLASDGIHYAFPINFTQGNLLFSGSPIPSGCGGTMAACMAKLVAATGGNVHITTPALDIYYFAGRALQGNCAGWAPTVGGAIYSGGTGGTTCSGYGPQLSQDQTARGDHYGDLVDQMRPWLATVPGTNTAIAPISSGYIENGDGYVNNGSGSVCIKPPELDWAVWSSILHGARYILYFGATGIGACPNQANGGFQTTILSGQTISVATQATSTNGKVLDLAPIITSPFAIGYASVSPVGYVFPTALYTLTNGIDIAAKWYTGSALNNTNCPSSSCGPGFYILATLHGSETQTNVTATFTLAGSPTKSGVPVVGESRTVNISSGSFTDTFGYPDNLVHIYGPITYP